MYMFRKILDRTAVSRAKTSVLGQQRLKAVFVTTFIEYY